MARRPTLHIIPILRWRRGGHQSFREAQLLLVSLLDGLIDQSGEESVCRGILLDGQTLVLDDYLELRPGESQTLANAIKSQGIDVGPWYAPPIEVLVHPESLIRNLMIGGARTSDIGTRLDVAVLPSSLGHIGQMPQILQGFGINAATVTDADKYMAGWWQGTDTSRVILMRAQPFNATSVPAIGGPSLSFFEITETNWADELTEVLGALQKQNRSLNCATGSLTEFAHNIDKAKLTDTVAGELRASTEIDAKIGMLSSRVSQKQRNHAVETLLVQWAEPFGAWADLLAFQAKSIQRSRSSLLGFAWRSLLQNHLPELLGGAHLDETAHEIEMRFRASEHIAQGLAQTCLAQIASAINTGVFDKGVSPAAVVFNGGAAANSDVIHLTLTVPEEQTRFEIVRPDGGTQPFQITTVSEADESGNVSVGLALSADVPPFGYTTYGLRQTASPIPIAVQDDGHEIENEFLSVTVSSENGTLTLFDKRTGRSFSDLNRFVDGGDAGDLGRYEPPQRDTLIDIATNTPLPIERHSGLVEQTLEWFQIYRVPRSLDEAYDTRLPFAAQFVPISIWTTARLKRGVPRLDIEVMISNAALDHRLRVHFPTGVYADAAHFDAAFEVVRRPVTQLSRPFSQRGFVTVMGSTTGLTIANRGLSEVEVRSTDQGLEVMLNLMRCVGRLRTTESGDFREYAARDAQCIGDYSFAYSLIPHDDNPLPAWHQAWNFQTAMLPLLIAPNNGFLPASASLVASANPWFKITSAKWANTANGLIVRGVNLSGDTQDVELNLPANARQVVRARLDESEDGAPLAVSTGRLTFTAQPNEIITYLILF